MSLVLLVGVLASVAQMVSHHTEASVLTCSPGDEVYSLYGHTALRIKDDSLGVDYVFNFGVFDFNTDYFIWKFTLGQTDYILMPVSYKDFMYEYETRGSEVKAQVLNLSQQEADDLFQYLIRTSRPENRTYRYNYLTNNCTTRVMDCVEGCINGSVSYSWDTDPETYRQIMHQYTVDSPWAQDGNDILLGADVDTTLSLRAKCFVPENYSRALDGAIIRDLTADSRPMVRRTEILLAAKPHVVVKDFPLSPMTVGWMAFVLMLLVAVIEYRCRRMIWLLDALILPIHGLAGALLLFVFLFSEHPTLGSNWQIWVLNPLPLVAMPYIIKAAWRKHRTLWHYILGAMLISFLLFIPWIPQHLCSMMIPLTLTLATRPVSWMINYGRAVEPSLVKSEKQ